MTRPSFSVSRTGSRTGRGRGLRVAPTVIGVLAVCASLTAGAIGTPAPTPTPSPSGTPAPTPKKAEAIGYGGAVSSVDADATAIGLDVLRRGGNAADAAVATAAALGVTEPYSTGIGGGGFLVYYDAKKKRVSTVDGRETAPKAFTPTTFQNADGTALDFATVVSSGLSVGVPGTPALWDRAVRQYGTRSLNQLLAPAQRLAERGFVVDQTFHDQTAANATRFARFPATAQLFLPGGSAPEVGTVFTNPDLARSLGILRRQGVKALYRGELGRAVVSTANAPQTTDGSAVYAGLITRKDLRAYRALTKKPVVSTYEDLTVYGMPTPSSGGIAVAETLNLLEEYPGGDLGGLSEVPYLHRFAEASATAFADRNRWVGDVKGVPVRELVSQDFAAERACQLFDPEKAAARPIPFGIPDGSYGTDHCVAPATAQPAARDDHGTSHVTVADRWGNVASYTLTIEQTGGSGITVPGYGFLLNNELTDFNFVPLTAGVPDPNLPGPGKRPRSSMSPTIFTQNGKPLLAVGSPGGATIITTTLQVALGRLDRGLSLVDAIAAPRISSRNGATSDAEPAVTTTALGSGLTALGHQLKETAEIGAATAVEFRPGGKLVAAAEPTRRGGGSAAVVDEVVKP
ncbi:gamma-glutamyltransferase [Kineosporia sp. J2-2]|uniref:Glutathione hydrolase proenzyme n=1 Tax=Kineosporia corallincola TaxID=2835133 RepID=A0ABS5TMK1_9ACTN|nr:gamma-glutamyltransferase [Kineosporia corallincola]MBT0772340.1 gamma-glutamyltransferase [Kineosporia corallincola]